MSFARFALVLPLAAFTFGCAQSEKKSNTEVVAAATPVPAAGPSRATIKPGGKSKVNGTVRFVPEGDQLHVIAEIRGLKPRSKHGFHIHEVGECAGPKFESAGGHYNPSNVAHGAPGSPQHHPGDLGNLTADRSGKAILDIMIPQGPSNDSFVGRSVIVHEKADDLKSQPTGDAGGRLACGLIETELP